VLATLVAVDPWLHVFWDGLIALSCFLIPIPLLTFVLRRCAISFSLRVPDVRRVHPGVRTYPRDGHLNDLVAGAS
jgi:hypothetical protein